MNERRTKELTIKDLVLYRNNYKLNIRKEKINKKIYLKRQITLNNAHNYLIDVDELKISLLIKEKFNEFNFDKINECIEYLSYLLNSENFDEKIYGLHILYNSIQKEINMKKNFNLNNFLVINEKQIIRKLQKIFIEGEKNFVLKYDNLLYEIYSIFVFFSEIIVNLSEDDNDLESVKNIENSFISDEYIQIYISHLINKNSNINSLIFSFLLNCLLYNKKNREKVFKYENHFLFKYLYQNLKKENLDDYELHLKLFCVIINQQSSFTEEEFENSFQILNPLLENKNEEILLTSLYGFSHLSKYKNFSLQFFKLLKNKSEFFNLIFDFEYQSNNSSKVYPILEILIDIIYYDENNEANIFYEELEIFLFINDILEIYDDEGIKIKFLNLLELYSQHNSNYIITCPIFQKIIDFLESYNYLIIKQSTLIIRNCLYLKNTKVLNEVYQNYPKLIPNLCKVLYYNTDINLIILCLESIRFFVINSEDICLNLCKDDFPSFIQNLSYSKNKEISLISNNILHYLDLYGILI